MKNVLFFMLKVLGLMGLMILSLWIMLGIWGCYNPQVQETTDLPIVEEEVVEERVLLSEETLCEFAEGFTSEGETVPQGTKVFGPAFVKPSRDSDWGLPIYVGEEYVTEASDEVIWLLQGDNACVDAQGVFFTHWDTDKP